MKTDISFLNQETQLELSLRMDTISDPKDSHAWFITSTEKILNVEFIYWKCSICEYELRTMLVDWGSYKDEVYPPSATLTCENIHLMNTEQLLRS
jgi:hypothetical protein